MSIFDSRQDRLDARVRLVPFMSTGGSASFPILAGLKTGTIAATSLTNATVLTDTSSGTIYMAVVTNGGSATDAQIIAGSGGNIVVGAAANHVTVAGALQTIASITGLTTATIYQLIALQVDGRGIHSLQNSITFTTA